MNYSAVVFASLGLLLLLAIVWLAFSGSPGKGALSDGRAEQRCLHTPHLPQIKQALADLDLTYLKDRGYPLLAKRLRKERRHIALNYLGCLRVEFGKLLHIARILAVMSPTVDVAREIQGLRLNLEFNYRYYLIYFRLVSGLAPFEAIGNLSNMVSALTIRMETAMRELGERAVLGADLLPHNGGGLDAGG